MTAEQRELVVRLVEEILVFIEGTFEDGMSLPQTVELTQVEGLPFHRLAITKER